MGPSGQRLLWSHQQEQSTMTIGFTSPLALQFLSFLGWARMQSICIAIGCSKPDLEQYFQAYIAHRPLLETLAFHQPGTGLSAAGLVSFSQRDYLKVLRCHCK